ncbi:MAG: TIGR03668 family PPOX class F420-dependent oxidoreductase [Candidatus Rariloculaceae bacterium]
MLDLSERGQRLLEESPVARLATVSADGVPHVVPICFVVSGSYVYSVIDEKPKRTTHLRRVRNIEENSRTALIIDYYDDDWSQLGWVMLQADAEILGSGKEHATAIKLLRKRYRQYKIMALDEAPLIRLHIQRATEWWAHV